MSASSGPALPTISVIVPTYAEEERLSALLGSLARQDYPAQAAEVIIVDDGSPAPVPSAATRQLLPFTSRLIRLPCNRGRAGARNAGLAHATGELVVFIDSDMTVVPGLLSALAQAQGGDPRRVVIGDIRYAPALRRTAIMRYQDSRGVHRLPPAAPVPFKCFVTGNSAVPRALVAAVGGFDASLRAYGGEDLELGYRLHLAGAVFAYAPAAGALHHHSRSLADTCALMYSYGRHSLPQLLERHPALAAVLRLPSRPSSGRATGRLLRLATAEAFCRVLRWGCRPLEARWLPSPVLSYLIWAARTRGYLHALQPAASG